MANSICPKCGSDNISFQREQTASIGGSLHSFSGKSGHGILYWLLVGWWIWIFKMIWGALKVCCTAGLSLLFRKKDKGKGKTITASKTFNRTVAVCQDCGKTWKV